MNAERRRGEVVWSTVVVALAAFWVIGVILTSGGLPQDRLLVEQPNPPGKRPYP